MITDDDQYILSLKMKISFGSCLFLALFFCSWLFFHHWILILGFPVFFWKGLHLLEDYLMVKRKKKLLLEFRDFLFSLATAFSTGRHMTEGIKEAVTYLYEIHGKKGVLQPELNYMIRAIEETGITDLDALSAFAEKVDLEDVYLFRDVYQACRKTGGALADSMYKAAYMISEKINLEYEIKNIVFQKKMEGRMIALMPFLILFFLQWMSPGYLDVMYTSAGGRGLMMLALVMTVVSYLWMERMTDVEL